MSRADNDQGEFELIHYETPDCAAEFSLDAVNETVWANQAQIAQLFGVTAKTVNEHIGNIFREGELEEDSVIRKFRITALTGTSKKPWRAARDRHESRFKGSLSGTTPLPRRRMAIAL